MDRKATKVRDMRISVRARNALVDGLLHAKGLTWDDRDKMTVTDVCDMTPVDLLKMKNLGRRALAEIVRALAAMGMTLAGGPSAPYADVGHEPSCEPGPCRAERLTRYRCAALAAFIARNELCPEAKAEEVAHTMLAAERGHVPAA